MKKKLLASLLGITLLTNTLAPMASAFEGFPAENFPFMTKGRNRVIDELSFLMKNEDLSDSINDYFSDYRKCYDNAPAGLKYKTYNLANGMGGIGKRVNLTDEDLEKQLLDGTITNEEYDYLTNCTWGGNPASRFLDVSYPSNTHNPHRPNNPNIQVGRTTGIIAKDHFVEWGLYKLSTGGEGYNFINSFYLFNGLPGTNKIDYWLKSLITSDNSFGAVQGTMNPKQEDEDQIKTRQGLKSWLTKHNQEKTKYLAYSFLSAEPVNASQKMGTKEFNLALKKYLANNKNTFITQMNSKKLWETYEFTVDGIKVLAVGLQLNPFWNIDKKTDFSQPTDPNELQSRNTYSSGSANASWLNSYYNHLRSQMPHLWSWRFGVTVNSFTKDADYYKMQTLTKNSTYYLQKLLNYEYITKENSPEIIPLAWISGNTQEYIKKVKESAKRFGITDQLRWMASGIEGYFTSGYYWNNNYYISGKYPKNVFSFYDTVNYLANLQFKWELVKGQESSEDFFFKNGTAKATLDLKQGVYLNSVISLANVVEWFDKVSENVYNYNWAVNYGFSFKPSNSNINVPMMVMDAFRGKFNPKIYDFFRTSDFSNPLSTTPTKPGAFSTVNEFIEDFKTKATLYSNDEEDDGEFIEDAKAQYDSEKDKKPLEVIRDNNLYGHYRTVKDFDSSVPTVMQVLGNVPTEYSSSVLSSNVIAMENLGDDYNALKETSKNLHYNIVDNNTTGCKDWHDNACLSTYWKVMESNPLSLVKFKPGTKFYAYSFPIGYMRSFKHGSSTCNDFYSSNTVVFNYGEKGYSPTWFAPNGFSVKTSNGEVTDDDLNNNIFVANYSYSDPFQYYGAGWIRNYPLGNTYQRIQDPNCATSAAWALAKGVSASDKEEALKNVTAWSSYDFTLSTKYSSSAKILNMVMVGNGTKTGVSQTTSFYDTKRRLLWAIGDYEIDASNKVTVNGRSLGTIKDNYLDNFKKTTGNLTLERNWKTIHTLPFGTYLLDEKPNAIYEPDKKDPNKQPIITVGKEKMPFQYIWYGYYAYYNETRNHYSEKILNDYGVQQLMEKVKVFEHNSFQKQVGWPTAHKYYDAVTYPSTTSANRKISENNSYGVYYLPNNSNRQKYVNVVTRITKNKTDLHANAVGARGYTFGLNAPIMVDSQSVEPLQTLTPYIQINDKEFGARIWNYELQISTRKNASQTEELLGLEQRVYKKPALLISFGEEGVVNQEGQYWQTNKNEEGVDRIDSLPYTKPYQEDATGKVEIDNAQRENTRTFFPLKKDFFDGFFGGSANKLPIQVGTDINENIKENKEALINALLLNLVNNNANINFKNLKKVNGMITPSVYLLEDKVNQKAYFLITVEDVATNNGKWVWALPVLIDGVQGTIGIYNKVKVNTNLTRFKETIGKGTSWMLSNDYYFSFSGANNMGGVNITNQNIYAIPNTTNALENMKSVFSRSALLFKEIIGVSKVENKNPLNLAWGNNTKDPHTIKSLIVADWEDVSLMDEDSREYVPYFTLKTWDQLTEEDGVKLPFNPSSWKYLNKEAFLWATQYIFGINKTLISDKHQKAIVDHESWEITDKDYENAGVADWEKEYVDNSKTNLWFYKMNFQNKKFITVFNMNHYTNAANNAPDKQILGNVQGEGNLSYASTDPEFKLNNTLLNTLGTFIPATSIVSKDHYDVAYKIDNNPVTTNGVTWGVSKGRINILSNFSKAHGMTISYLGNEDMLDKMTTELRCGDKPTKVINFKQNNGVWISNDYYDMYTGKNPQECYLQFNIQTPSNIQEAVKMSGQKFEFEINLDTSRQSKGLWEKKHAFEIKAYNISDSLNITDIESIPKCRIVAKTKSTVWDSNTIAGTSITDTSSTVELDVWYKNPELTSANNYVTKKALLGTYIDLELTGNAQFKNFNAEYYTALAKKQAMSYANGLAKNEYSEKLQSLLSSWASSYSQKKIRMFVWGSHFKKNKFYWKTTFTVVPLNWNINDFAFRVKGDCEFVYLNDTKKINSDTNISFTYPKSNGQKDSGTMSYYNPVNKAWGTLYSSWYSKVQTTVNGNTLNFLVKQYYPSILSVSYNHVSKAQGLDMTSKIQWVDNGANSSDVLEGNIQQWGKGCMTAEKKINSPSHWVNGTAEQCLRNGGIGGSALNYPINHPAKWGSGWGHGIINITSGEGENAYGVNLHNTESTSHNGNRSGRSKDVCTHWVRNGVWDVYCGEATFQSRRVSINSNGVWSWEKLGQGFGGYYYIWFDGSFDIDKKIVGKENDGNSKVFFDKILPICMENGTTEGRYRTLTLSEKNAVLMVDNGWELNNVFKNSINGKVCHVNGKSIKLHPINENATYLYKNKPLDIDNVVDKFTGLPFFMKSPMLWKAPNITGAGGNTGVQATVDKEWMLHLYFHEEILKAIKNNPENVKIEFRFVDADKANGVNYGVNNIPWGSGFQILGWNNLWSVGIDTTKEWKLQVMFRVGLRLDLSSIKWPAEIKTNKLYKLLDEGIKDLKKDRIFEMQLPVVVMSSYGESFANSGSTMNEVFLQKTGKTMDGMKASLTDNFSLQMKYKKFAASSYRTGHNTVKTWFRRHRACGRRRCRNRTSKGFWWQTQQYNSTAQSNDYIRGFNPSLTNMNDVVKDNVVNTFYPYTDNAGDQINNKTVLINGIPSIKNIDKNQLLYQGVCNVCNQYRGNIFEQHPVGAFNPEHREKGSQQNIFDYYTDTRNFTVVPVHNTTKQEVANISGDVSGKTLALKHKEPFVSRLTFEPEVKVVEIMPTSVEDSTKSALKYYGKKAVIVGKKNAGEAPATLLISWDIIPEDFENLGKKKIESELVLVSEGDIVIGSDVNFVNAILVTKGNLIIMPGNTWFKLHGGAIVNGKIMNYRTNVTDIKPSSYALNYQTYLKNLDLFDMKYPVLFTLDPRYASSKIFTYIGSVSKTTAR